MSDIGLHQSPSQETQNQHTKWPASDNIGARSNKLHKHHIQREIEGGMKLCWGKFHFFLLYSFFPLFLFYFSFLFLFYFSFFLFFFYVFLFLFFIFFLFMFFSSLILFFFSYSFCCYCFWSFFVCLFSLFCQHQYRSLQAMLSVEPHSQPAWMGQQKSRPNYNRRAHVTMHPTEEIKETAPLCPTGHLLHKPIPQRLGVIVILSNI